MKHRSWLGWVAVLSLAGCVGLPSSGTVQQGLERAPEPEGIVFLAPDPQPGASPEDIVAGFLDAATAGVADRFQTAQKYLTDDARSTWDPGAQVTIYTGTSPPQVQEEAPGAVSVTVSVAGYVDSSGIYSEEAGEVSKTLEFNLTRHQGQWRISSLEDGVLISGVNFETQYRQVPLAFFSADGNHIIPDPRWFPEQNAASFAVSALLEGPVEWMASGVVTAVPPGTSAEPVNISDGIADVRLSEAALAASPTDRAMVVTQLQQTLQNLPQVRKVRSVVDDIPFGDSPQGVDPVYDPPVGHNPVALTQEGLATISGATLSPLDDGGVEPDHPYTAVAVPYGELETESAPIVLREEDQAIVALQGGEETQILFKGNDVVAPSYDPHGWVWTAQANSRGSLVALNPETGQVVEVEAPGLADQHTVAARVSRDGARIALIQRRDRELMVQVAMVIRDESATPVEISEPVTIGQSISAPTDVTWVDALTLAVLGKDEDDTPAVSLLPLAGPPQQLAPIDHAQSVASGKGERELWVSTDEGELFNRAGNSWRQVEEDVEVIDLAFPG
ncbi:MAG TPA: LpqB family beta-propeller domain-containing protein [Beutenbergiaceae bacterium]|nr:LpqB family beta-propeller domain-containing protein [Beutenbergiaceae bacterium]